VLLSVVYLVEKWEGNWEIIVWTGTSQLTQFGGYEQLVQRRFGRVKGWVWGQQRCRGVNHVDQGGGFGVRDANANCPPEIPLRIHPNTPFQAKNSFFSGEGLSSKLKSLSSANCRPNFVIKPSEFTKTPCQADPEGLVWGDGKVRGWCTLPPGKGSGDGAPPQKKRSFLISSA